MRLSGLCLFLVMSGIAHAETLVIQRVPVVVYEGPSIVSAETYYRRLKPSETAAPSPQVPQGAGVTAIEQQLPIQSTRLRVGKPSLQVQDGQVIPLFIMGMDATSLHWFSRAADGLAEMGARGVVVQANRLEDWQQLKAHAANLGIDVMLLPGDSLAEGYGISTYPVVIVSPALEVPGYE